MRLQDRRWHECLSAWSGAIVLAVWSLCIGVVPAVASSRPYRVAVLTPGLPFNLALEGLREGLTQLGYHEGKDVIFLVEDAQGEIVSLASRATKLVTAKPDIIFTIGTAATAVAKQATTTLPIVFTWVGDPLRSGLIASYTSSQNNLTGIASYSGPLSGKRLEVLQEIAPGTKRVLALVVPQDSVAEVSYQALAEVAPKLGIELLRHDVSSKEEIEQRLKALPKGTVDAICHVPSSLVGTHIDLLIDKAKQDRIPLVVHEHSMIERGALISYGADFRLLGMQAAKLVAKIVSGAKPAEVRIQTPEQLVLTLNLSTAKAIGLNIPLSMLERAERLVE
jgi:putative tryptophan/tyrosine transport system substrate-binding protein